MRTATIGALKRETQDRYKRLAVLRLEIEDTEAKLDGLGRDVTTLVEEIASLEGTLDALAPGWDDDE